MKYIEFYDYVKRDAILYTYLLSNFSHVFKKINAWESIEVDRDHILVMKNGTLIEESTGKKKGIARCFFQQSFVFPTRHTLELKALETTEFCLIPADAVFGKLEQEQILSVFFLQIAEKNEQDLKRQELLITEASKNKIIATLNFLLENNLSNKTLPVFSDWLHINILAKLANCSVPTTSSIVNELHDKGILDIKSSPWKLTSRDMRIEHFEKEA
ncbi:Crp/Fnr family transcriptional regulator [Listeria seeligeri]|uniref:Crp/Fnr family transcriptional regulator n=1 Tax=Listeria seeligeri TaxID=1640 RepID=UPI0001C4E2FB|nr:Crp/Fnr family transcriptional regulator [Listeria seeligeri]MBC1722920.1 Crp/Fnr family transcriptional regulator [Listeria seeligeri]MBF2346059.1 Crp/Fnr family transcriptional regulator [Listeria seeligeri]MBF2436780.1 Crp/Fnr family transcriptional regulator [Listeria seeligeri]MBF2480874.1 Crp/Fnr family transcriptional regulator [Listeria seeligeri]MBF2598682.1 Crp/Fnr family transcriptional regulator [Listeria seeligeri]